GSSGGAACTAPAASRSRISLRAPFCVGMPATVGACPIPPPPAFSGGFVLSGGSFGESAELLGDFRAAGLLYFFPRLFFDEAPYPGGGFGSDAARQHSPPSRVEVVGTSGVVFADASADEDVGLLLQLSPPVPPVQPAGGVCADEQPRVFAYLVQCLGGGERVYGVGGLRPPADGVSAHLLPPCGELV